MNKRNRFKQTEVLEDRLAAQARHLREQAEKLAPGPKREEMMRRAKQCEDGAQMSEFLRRPSPQPQR